MGTIQEFIIGCLIFSAAIKARWLILEFIMRQKEKHKKSV
jgi:hypothetical protein